VVLAPTKTDGDPRPPTKARDGSEDLLRVSCANGEGILHRSPHARESETGAHIGEKGIRGSKIEPQQLEEDDQQVVDFDGEHVDEKTQPAQKRSTDQHHAQHSALFVTVSPTSLQQPIGLAAVPPG
jgi:hypothetical protein